VLFSLPRSVQLLKLSLKLINKNVKIVKKGLGLRGLFTHSIYREVVNYFYIRFIPVSGYFI